MLHDKDTQWVHEADYGEPAFGGVIGALFTIAVGIIGLILGLFAAPKGRHHE